MAGPKRRIRVLQTIGSMHIGGAENVVVEIARGLDRDRFEVELCCTKELGVLADQVARDGVPVVLAAAPSHALRHLTSFYLHRVIRRFKPDVVHTHGTPSLLHVAPLAALGLTPRWIHTFHYGNYAAVQGRQFELERRFCRRATDLVAVSEAQRQSIIERYTLDASRIVTVTNGLRYAAADGDDTARLREELGFGPDDVIVGAVAVLSEQKGITYLLKAAGRILVRHPHVRLLIVGGGPAEAALRSEAQALGLDGRITFTGWRTDAQRFLALFHVWVMSSLWEAMPMALVEAMAAERRIVVTDVGDNRAIVDNGACATIVPPRDPAALASAIGDCLDDPDAAALRARRAAGKFVTHYTTTHMVSAYERLYARDAPAQSPRDDATRSYTASSRSARVSQE